MLFADVYLVSDKRLIVPLKEIDNLASWLPVPLPSGYRDYLTILGVGTFCDLVNLHPPKTVRDGFEEHRRFVAEYYRQFWGRSEGILPFDRAINSVRVATSLDGDIFILCLDRPDRVFILPRHDDRVYWLEKGFEDPLSWTAGDGLELVIRTPFCYFEPWQDRHIIEFFTAKSFEMDSVTARIASRWPRGVRTIHWDQCLLLFASDIGGRLQFTQCPGDHRVRVRFDYDSDRNLQVEQLADELKQMGFFETHRHPAATHSS